MRIRDGARHARVRAGERAARPRRTVTRAATAELFRALSDPARVRIVNLLATSEEQICVCNLVEPLGLSQPTVSHHLKKLLDAGLVERHQRGKWAYFSLERGAVEKLAVVADLKGACCT